MIEVEKIDEGIKVLEGDIEVSFETENNYKKFMNNISKYAKIKIAKQIYFKSNNR